MLVFELFILDDTTGSSFVKADILGITIVFSKTVSLCVGCSVENTIDSLLFDSVTLLFTSITLLLLSGVFESSFPHFKQYCTSLGFS